MSRVEVLARRAWQLKEQGYALEEIADAMGKPVSAIERWIGQWPGISDQTPPWHEGLSTHTVHYLRKAGITSREALIEAWEDGFLRGQSAGFGVSRLLELQHWLKTTGTELPKPQPKTMVVDLSPEAEAALNHLRKVTGQNASQLINRLLVEADDIDRLN